MICSYSSFIFENYTQRRELLRNTEHICKRRFNNFLTIQTRIVPLMEIND